MALKDPYDCQNSGEIQQTTVNGGLNVSYCKCLDLFTSGPNTTYFTGPQCSYQVTIDSEVQPKLQLGAAADQPQPQFYDYSSDSHTDSGGLAYQDFEEESSRPIATAQVGKTSYETDNTCGTGCNNAGICKKEVCYCDKYHSG